MYIEMKLKTGFYETATYKMAVRKNQIFLSPIFNNFKKEHIVINAGELISVLLTIRKNPEIIIQTWERTYSGVLNPATDVKELVFLLKKELNQDINVEMN